MIFNIINLLPIEADIRLLSVNKSKNFPTLVSGNFGFLPIGIDNKQIEAGIRLPAIGEISCANASDHVNKIKLKGNFNVKINDWVSDKAWSANEIETVFNDEDMNATSSDAGDGFVYLNITVKQPAQLRITITPENTESLIDDTEIEGTFTFVDSVGVLTFCLELQSVVEGLQTSGAESGLYPLSFGGNANTVFKATLYFDDKAPLVVNSYEEFEAALKANGYSYTKKEEVQ